MANEIRLPRLGQGMESGFIVKWLKEEGEPVFKGEPLFEVDTEKATQEVEAEADGVLLRIDVPEGDVPVGWTVGVIGQPGEDLPPPVAGPAAQAAEGAAPDAATPEADAVAETASEETVPEETATAEQPVEAEGATGEPAVTEADTATGATEEFEPVSGADFRAAFNGARAETGGEPTVIGGRTKASPLARRIARERGVDLGQVTGTGPDGRIIAEDVERAGSGAPTAEPQAAPVVAAADVSAVEARSVETPAVETPAVEAPAVEAPGAEAVPEAALPPAAAVAPAPPGEPERIPLTSIRKTIARRLTAAWAIPTFQLTVTVDMTHANALVERSRELNPETRVTVTDLLAKVCARALVRHPEVNAQYTDEAILRFPSANVGIAVAAPQGLVVPVIRGVERLSLVEVARARADVVERSRAAKLSPGDFDGGTFTISNLGMFGVEQFTAVLNPPQAAILAVGATVDRPVAEDGQVVIRPIMSMTLTVDHRTVDGGPAAEFLRTVKTFLEDPALAL